MDCSSETPKTLFLSPLLLALRSCVTSSTQSYCYWKQQNAPSSPRTTYCMQASKRTRAPVILSKCKHIPNCKLPSFRGANFDQPLPTSCLYNHCPSVCPPFIYLIFAISAEVKCLVTETCPLVLCVTLKLPLELFCLTSNTIVQTLPSVLIRLLPQSCEDGHINIERIACSHKAICEFSAFPFCKPKKQF